MTLDLTVLGVRLYLNFGRAGTDSDSTEASSEPAPAAPTHLGTPMRVSSGYTGFYQTRPDYTEVHRG